MNMLHWEKCKHMKGIITELTSQCEGQTAKINGLISQLACVQQEGTHECTDASSERASVRVCECADVRVSE